LEAITRIHDRAVWVEPMIAGSVFSDHFSQSIGIQSRHRWYSVPERGMALTFDAVCTIVSHRVPLISDVLPKRREYTMLAEPEELSDCTTAGFYWT
jgi:hypothetical protein